MRSIRNGMPSDDAPVPAAFTEHLALRCLEIAREAVVEAVTRGRATPCPEGDEREERLVSQGGVFVTLRRNRRLRGCVGYPLPDLPLVEAVWRSAQQAALEDPRFEPVRSREIPQVAIEVSLLGPLRPLASPEEFEPGRHGVVLEADGKRGLYLPEVAIETGWPLERLLDELALKAGLAVGGWRSPDARLSAFETTTAEGPARPKASFCPGAG